MPNKMDQNQVHGRHFAHFLFTQGFKATQTTKNIFATNGQVLEVRRFQNWFRKISIGDRSLENPPRSGGDVTFNFDLLKQSMRITLLIQLDNKPPKINRPHPTIFDHFYNFGRILIKGV